MLQVLYPWLGATFIKKSNFILKIWIYEEIQGRITRIKTLSNRYLPLEKNFIRKFPKFQSITNFPNFSLLPALNTNYPLICSKPLESPSKKISSMNYRGIENYEICFRSGFFNNAINLRFFFFSRSVLNI